MPTPVSRTEFDTCTGHDPHPEECHQHDGTLCSPCLAYSDALEDGDDVERDAFDACTNTDPFPEECPDDAPCEGCDEHAAARHG